MNTEISEILGELLREPGISGFENDIAQFAAARLEKYCDKVIINRFRSVTGWIPSKAEKAKTIVLTAHLDRIGLIVSGVDENGFVSFDALGGVDARILPASEVYILGRERVFGIIGAKPPHLLSKSDSAAGVTLDSMLIDTGMSGDAAKALIAPGDPILLRSSYSEMLNGCITSAALDNRAGMAAVFYCLEGLRGSELPFNIKVVFTSGEETGLHGAYTALNGEPADLAVVVDVTHGTTPDAPKVGTFPLGCGAVICRGPNLHYDITKRITALASEKSIPYEIEVAGGSSGTDAWALQTLRGGIACALISIPLRYMHTTVETVQLSDICDTGRLLGEIVRGGVELA